MAWTADKVKQLRQSSPGQSAKQDEKDGKWTADRVRQVRTTTPASTAPKTEKAQTAKTAAKDSALEKAYEDYRLGNNLGFADEMDRRSDVLNRQKVSTSWQSKLNLADQMEQATEEVNRRQALRKSGAWTDTYTIVNNWKDSSDRNRELADLVTARKTPQRVSAADLPAGADYLAADTGGLVNQTDLTADQYTDAELRQKGYTQTEINRARNYLKDYSSLNPLGVAARRLESTEEGKLESLKGGTAMYAGALSQALTASPEEQMIRRIQSGRYTDEQLEQAGYAPELIRTAHERIASGKTLDLAADDSNRLKELYEKGRETHAAGERLMADAQAGESAPVKFLHNAAAGAAENLELMALNPWLVLPVLSAQGAGDSMAASDEKGESPEKAVLKASLKFGAGWAINSVGVADLAKTMGAGTAKDSVAGQIAEWVRKVSSSEALREKYPAVANAVSGGIDNAMQAFVETYADQAIDAALGDSEAAQSLLTRDTFLQALESGLTGGASGALGGAVGTGLSRMNAGDSSLRGNVERYAAQDEYEQALKEHQRREELAREPGQTAQEAAEPSQSKPDGFASSPEGGARGGSGEAEADWVKPLSHAARDSSPTEGSPWQDGKAVLDEQSPMGREAPGSAAEGSGQTVENPGESVESAGAKSDNAAVRAYAAAVQSNSLTAKTIRLFAPEAGNEANRAAFAEAYGVELPGTAAATRRALRETAAQENAARKAANAEQQAANAAETAAGPEGDILTLDGAGDETPDQRNEPEEKTLSQREGDSSREAGQPSQSAQSAASSPEGRANASAGEAEAETGLRETYGMEAPRTEGQKQARTEQVLRSWKVGEKAAQEISLKQPEGVDSDRYAAAASTLYRLGQMEDVKSFDQALELAGTGSGMAANVNYVLGNIKGRNALQIAYTYGRDVVETRWEKSQLGGSLSDKSLTSRGETIYKGTLRTGNDVGSQVIELNAAATGTTAVMKNVLMNNQNVKAYVETETARIFFGDSAQDVFGTVLHEDYHWYNALDSEGAKALQNHALLYLAKSSGFETVDEMIREKMTDYAQQGLTYEEAAEELVGDAWRGIFSTESDFKRWVEFQRGQAEKNSGKAGTIRTVMNRVKEMLGSILSRAREVLEIDPDNRAALKAQRLAENERKILQDEYFAHAEKAMDNLRSAKENAADLKTESAAEGHNVRFSIQKDADGESYIKIDEDILNGVPREEWKTVVKQAIKERYPNGFERNGWTILNSKEGRKEFVWSKYTKGLQWENGTAYADKLRMAANLDEIIWTADEVYREPAFHKNAEAFNRGKIKVMVGPNAYEADVLTAIKADDREIFYDIVDVQPTKIEPSGKAHMESEDSGSRGSEGSIYQESADTVLKTEEGGERPSFPAKNSIAQENAESKGNSEPVKKSVRFQLSAPVEVDQNKDLVAVHNLTAENLQEALELGGMPSPSIAVVKAQEGHTKYGPISLVFNSDTIDPMVNRANRIYGSDAWTPTRPAVEYKVKPDKARALNTELAELSRKTAGGEFARSNSITGIMDMEASDKSPKQLAEKLAQNPSVKAAYLADIGETVDVAMKQEERFTASQVRRSEKTIEAVGGEETLRNIIETDRANDNHDLAHTVLEKVREAEKAWAMEEFGWSEEKAQKKAERVIPPKLLMLLNSAYDYMVTEDKSGKLVRDTDTMLKEVQEKAPDKDVEAWILPKVEKILGEKGIYNGKEIYTRNGNRRSFAQLHNSYTLENLVAAMNQQDARGQGAWGLAASTLMSTATAEYQNLDEVRADKGRLQQMPKEEYKALLEKADDQISDVLDKLRRETTAHADNSFEEREILGDILLRAAQGKQTAAAIGKAFAKEGYTIGKDTAQMILNLYKNVAAIPTGYFEAKPQRAVGFDEVRAAILPDNTSRALIDSLKETGIDVQLYKAGDDDQRTALLNKVPNVRFQLAEQADRESRKNVQRQASRAIADNSVMLETLGEMMGITHGVRISQDSIEGLALRWTKTNASKADRVKLAGETRALVEYLKADGADMSKAQSLAETLAGEVLDGATYRNTELWDQYPEFHELSYTVNKDGQAKAELVRRYGSWSEAVAEARRHGVKLRQAEGVRDGNPAEQYESIVNDTRAVGGVKDGAAALFRQAAKKAGVDGAASMESTEWLDILMNVRDAIKPKVMSRFEDAAEYEDAKVELAGRMIGDILNTPEMNDAQAIFDSFQKWQRYAVAAAVGEENVDAALKELRKVQKDQSRDFNQRLYENQRKGSRNEALQKLAEMQVSDAKAEQLLDRNLETLGVDITNSGDLAEKLDLLKEAYERGWKEEKQRLREERQDMIDSIRLENQKLKRENYALSYEVAGEQKRADAAEWQLIHQQNELMEWEDENQRKAQKWQEEQARRNAIAVEAAREMRDRDVAAAKKSRDRDVAKAREMRDRDIAWAEQVAARRVEIARAGRRKDEYRRIIRNNRAQLNQMILHPSKDRYVQPHLIKQAAAVAQIADMALVNDSTMARLTRLRDSIADEIGKEASPSGMSTDWDNSGIKTMIEALTKSMSDTKEAKLDRLRGQLAEAEALPESDKARDLRASLERRIRETEKQPCQPMTADQLQLLKAITTSTLHVIRTANKTLSQEKAEAVDKIAQDAAEEVIRSKGNGGKLRNALTKYNLDMLGGTRVFRMLGGYTKNGQMEKLAAMLNDGQRKQTQITVEGTKLFDNVTGKANLKQMQKFAGPGAELVDIGLKDSKGRAAPLTHAQLCSLYMHLQNADSREHLLNGGLTIPDAEEYNRGDIEKAYQKGQTVKIGMLTDSAGNPMADTVIQAVENALTDYDRAWCEDMKQFFGSYTTNLINETSMKLLGYQRATVKNYYPIAVDKAALATQIEGLQLDATIEGRGFLKNRVKSAKPILLEECSSVVQRSLRDTAAYAGLAAPIRDVQKVLSCGIETVDGIKVLKDGILKEKWGSSAVNYVNDLLTDLQTKQRRRDNGISRAMRKLRGNYAAAILTLNPGVAIAQAASLPTAGAVLGADTMAAVVPFVKNLSGKQRAALEAEIAEHGDALLQYRLRGSRQGELASVGVDRGMVQNAMDKLPKGLTGWITTMDEITVASLWEGAKRYVEHHESLTASDGDSYWTAVNRMYQKVIEETQPNYTTMQRAGIQRNPDELVKSMTMFTTQRFQNYGILADAVMDYNAQRTRCKEGRSEDAKAELDRAGQNLSRAVTSQVVQTAVFALMKIGADFLLHRRDREQDENGDITALSVAKRFAGLYTESAAGNFLYGSELYALVNNAIQGKDYDVVSATNISAVNDLATSVLKLERLLKKDTSEMDEDELKAHHAKVQAAWVSVAEYGLSVKGVPAANVEKIVEAFKGYAGDVEKAAKGEGFSFSSLPSSATGQYDRLYNAIQSGDSEEAKAALGKLEAMGKDEKTISTQLKNRLKKYSPEVEQAAKARNEGNDRERRAVTVQLIRDLYEAMGIREGVKADAEKRAWVIDLVTGAIDSKADELLAGGTEGSVYDDLTEALDSDRAKEVQDEIKRLRTAGKEDGNIKTKITAAVKEEYLAGNDHDRAKLEQMLLQLEKADGSQMYEEKNFAQWVKDAAKKEEQAKNSKDEWAGVR